MWSLVNRTRFAADRGWIRDQHGAETWVVAVKAVYNILADGSLRSAVQQVPVHAGPLLDPLTGELCAETDLGPAKSGTDVVLLGHAYSPTGEPVTELSVGFRVGSLTRMAIVFGDRTWRRSITGHSPGAPEPFVRMPLTYARALGGDEQDAPHATGNPLGRGLVRRPGQPFLMPNIEDAAQRLSAPSARPPVVAFGPVPERWPWRARYAGTYDDDWFENRRPLLPDDVDERSWRIAPPAQQLAAHLRGGETVGLLNLTPPGFCPDSRLVFELPRLTLGFETRFYDGSVERSRSTIHTLILEPDLPQLTVVHHMALPCHPKVNLLDRTIITEKLRPLSSPGTGRQAEWAG